MISPLVSVIIPIYKVEQYLRQCVDSVLAQSYQNLEIILVDDGSPGRCPSICDEYIETDSRIKVIHKLNGGLSDARNVGTDISTGDYLFYLDGDDYLSPKCIEELIDVSVNGDLAITGYLLDLSDENKIVKADQLYGHFPTIIEYTAEFYNLFATKFNFAWGKLYNANIIRKHHLKFRTGISLVEDVLFNLDYYRYCSKGIIAISSNGYYYRQHGGATLSKKFNPKMFEWNEVGFSSVRSFLKEFGCFTDKNRDHLYKNIVGNFLYGFSLVANDPTKSNTEKASIIRENKEIPIFRESLTVKQNKRIDYRLKQFLLNHNLVRTYIYFENFKRKLKNVNN